jgi:CheY-like chemotaxis protein
VLHTIMDGFSVCTELRRNEKRLPVLMLTARGDVSDRIRGSTPGPTTTSSSRSTSASSSPACGRLPPNPT